MAHVTAPGVQAWLESTKLTVDTVDASLDSVATTLVFGRIGGMFHTETWADTTNTPDIIQTVFCMLIAAWIYRRTYAEVVESDNTFATWLETLAENTILGILGGSIEIPGAIPLAVGITEATAWPDDTTGSSQQFDASGAIIGADQYSEGIKFTMGARF